uniref:Uncharacterized protein n=1 Tax=Eutreptiella gymnastica TaxID=73025 RepID=A0A7S4FYG5_9EUGL
MSYKSNMPYAARMTHAIQGGETIQCLRRAVQMGLQRRRAPPGCALVWSIVGSVMARGWHKSKIEGAQSTPAGPTTDKNSRQCQHAAQQHPGGRPERGIVTACT